MKTKTLIEAIAQIKSNDYAVRFRMLLKIFSAYDTKFTRLNALTFFEEVPATFIWANEDSVNSSFKYNGTIFRPNTMADFISIVNSLGLDLQPRFSSNPNSDAVVFWNNDRRRAC